MRLIAPYLSTFTAALVLMGPAIHAQAADQVRQPATNWQLLDPDADHVLGTSVERAYRELLTGVAPRKTVVVAVIDGGVDTAHADLRANIWVNPRETAGNGKDDDNNGYIDDVHGWDFIGGAGNKDVDHDTFELTRLYARCAGIQTTSSAALPAMDATRCAAITDEFEKKRTETTTELEQIREISLLQERLLPVLRRALAGDSVTPERVAALQTADSSVNQARGMYMRMVSSGATPEAIAEALKAYGSQAQYGLNANYDPRGIVGDNYADVSQRAYGNADFTGPDAQHGTHVAGIIGAVRGNGIGIDGIASAVRIMVIRAVPDGDERDKDIANAIRYAADNGANIINMSFGKSYSPFKGAVDDAVKYAESKGLLLIHAAGNDGADLATSTDYPTRTYLSGGSAQNWIEVGASSWRGGDTVAVNFSNYGKTQVDLFAPGEDILSTVQGGGYERLSGTSMAAPVVTGVAALVLSYYPSLTAAQLKSVLLESATSLATHATIQPGAQDGKLVQFGTLSRSGGIVNAYAALKMAARISAAH